MKDAIKVNDAVSAIVDFKNEVSYFRNQVSTAADILEKRPDNVDTVKKCTTIIKDALERMKQYPIA